MSIIRHKYINGNSKTSKISKKKIKVKPINKKNKFITKLINELENEVN